MSKAFGSFPSEISLASMWRGLRRTGSAAALSLAVLGMSPAYAEVDVNSADEAALTSVKGIGPSTAKRIVGERDKNGAMNLPTAKAYGL